MPFVLRCGSASHADDLVCCSATDATRLESQMKAACDVLRLRCHAEGPTATAGNKQVTGHRHEHWWKDDQLRSELA